MSLSQYNPGQELSSINFGGMIGGPLSAVVDAQSQAALSTIDFIKSVGFTPDFEDETTGQITPGSPIYVTFKYPKMMSPYVPRVDGTVDTASVNAGGQDYTAGDVLNLGSGDATVRVDTVDSNGAITAISVLNNGSGYSAGNQPGTGGTGTGASIAITVQDIDAIPAVFEQMLLEVPILTMLPIPHIRIDYAEIDFHAKITSMEYRNVGSTFNASSGFAARRSTTASGSVGTGTLASFFGAKAKGSVSSTSSVELKVNVSYQRSVKEGHKIDKTYQLGVKVRASQDEMPGGMEKILSILEDAIVAQPVS